MSAHERYLEASRLESDCHTAVERQAAVIKACRKTSITEREAEQRWLDNLNAELEKAVELKNKRWAELQLERAREAEIKKENERAQEIQELKDRVSALEKLLGVPGQ